MRPCRHVGAEGDGWVVSYWLVGVDIPLPACVSANACTNARVQVGVSRPLSMHCVPHMCLPPTSWPVTCLTYEFPLQGAQFGLTFTSSCLGLGLK
jgi:hypothetical protein